jgi:hypothetical protein
MIDRPDSNQNLVKTQSNQSRIQLEFLTDPIHQPMPNLLEVSGLNSLLGPVDLLESPIFVRHC